jgi:SAM-dependent methyltransferase
MGRHLIQQSAMDMRARADEVGLRFDGVDAASADVVVDVRFEGRRVWSFWVRRDRDPGEAGHLVRWPASLAPYLDGVTRVAVIDHVDGAVLLDEEVWFGTSEARIAVVDHAGTPLAVDSAGHLSPTFETRNAALVAPLLDSVEQLLGVLHELGVDTFPAYGTLLGAVRQGALIGHDNDADLGYISRFETPVDVIRESFRLQRRLTRLGYRVRRYSAGAFRVDVVEPDGFVRGLDVFGGFFEGGNLTLLGEIYTPFDRSSIFPLGTTVLEGRTLPAPHRPEDVLAATYGPSWRVPDPAFVFEKPDSTYRRLNSWFRGTGVGRREWDSMYSKAALRPPRTKPSSLARFVARHATDTELVVDIGCGRGSDAAWLAGRGTAVLGLDFAPEGFATMAARAAAQGWPLEFREFNLLKWRQAATTAALLAHRPERRTLLARHLVDALTPGSRPALWSFASVVLRGGGRLYADFLCEAAPDDKWARDMLLTPRNPDVVVAEIEASGGRIVERERLSTHEMGLHIRHDRHAEFRAACRLVVEWAHEFPVRRPPGPK